MGRVYLLKSVIIRSMVQEDKKRVLVTGAAGFLGSHLVDRLLTNGMHVIGVDNLLTGRKENLVEAIKNNHFTFLEGDAIAPPNTYLPEDFVPDYIFHLASPASPPRYQQLPIETYLVNSLGTHNILQYVLANTPMTRVVYASSSEVYGNPKETPQKESYWGNVNPNGLRSCYDEGKRFGETICGVHVREFDLDVRIMRIFNTYGPRMNPVDGRVIPNFIQQALRNEPLTIYGDGSQSRSFCYVSDLIGGMMALMFSEKGKGETMNLGNPIEKSMIEVAEIIKRATCSKSTFEQHDLPIDDPKTRNPNITKAKEVLEWEPRVGFEDGLRKTIEYFKQTIV